MHAHEVLLESPPSPLSPSNPPGTPLHAPCPSRSDPAPTSGKRERSGSASDKVLSQDDLRHGLKPPGKRPKFVKPSPPPSPTPSQSKNPSALLVIGQRLPSLLRGNLPGRICLVRKAQGKQNTSVFTLASILNTLLLQHPTHHTLIVLTDFPWATMGLEAETDLTVGLCNWEH